ncbi:hypothetical protein F2Q69_00038400 [Brassica cretica]|uniref:VQ domain-containing protein n=2 Tax=Brassica cretica TaxID=69181 RepID=A0ABQ7C6S1_BRACR|nr:hypothetical protein DY000_02001789 [Brassica cretica]KAF3602664.1 hypothetical protein F2Q69_00038400 [Brassica cretica]
METVKTSRFITEVAPTKLISPTREPFKNMLTTISEEDFDFEELVRATSGRLSSSNPGFSPGLLVTTPRSTNSLLFLRPLFFFFFQ